MIRHNMCICIYIFTGGWGGGYSESSFQHLLFDYYNYFINCIHTGVGMLVSNALRYTILSSHMRTIYSKYIYLRKLFIYGTCNNGRIA